MFGFGTAELVIFCVIVLLLFGHRLPMAFRSVGESIRSFRDGTREADRS